MNKRPEAGSATGVLDGLLWIICSQERWRWVTGVADTFCRSERFGLAE